MSLLIEEKDNEIQKVDLKMQQQIKLKNIALEDIRQKNESLKKSLLDKTNESKAQSDQVRAL